jgi:serine/threonine-protein kinase
MDIVAHVAAGLHAAHAAGMVHRDVKPGNLLLAPRGTVKITDFGIAHTVDSASVTASGELIGTPAYLAPERTTGERAGPGSDLYSLGIVAYECLTGVRPYTGTPLEVALAHRDRLLPPLPPSVAPDVAAFVMRLTAKDPASRPGDTAEVAAWAALLRDGVSVPPPDRDRARRLAVLAYACAAIAAVIVIVVASVIGFASPSHPVAGSPSTGPASSSPPAPASRAGGAAAAPSAHPTASPARPTPASPAAHQQPAAVTPVVMTVRPGHGHGNGQGDDNGNGNGKGKGKGDDHGGGD